jgi:hypothetical protein
MIPSPALENHMCRILPLALLAFSFALPLTAHADTIDDFTLVGGGHTITYSLPASAVIMDHPHVVSVFASAPATVDGVSGYTASGQYDVPGVQWVGGGGGVTFSVSVPPFIIDDLPRHSDFFSGAWILEVSEVLPVSNPSFTHPDDLLITFVPGSFSLSNFLSPSPYTLTITAETADTPEPSSLILLATGSFCLLGAIMTRRLTRA